MSTDYYLPCPGCTGDHRHPQPPLIAHASYGGTQRGTHITWKLPPHTLRPDTVLVNGDDYTTITVAQLQATEGAGKAD